MQQRRPSTTKNKRIMFLEKDVWGSIRGSGRALPPGLPVSSPLGPAPCCPLLTNAAPSSRPPAPSGLLFRVGGGPVGVTPHATPLGLAMGLTLHSAPSPAWPLLSSQSVGPWAGSAPTSCGDVGSFSLFCRKQGALGDPCPPHGPRALTLTLPLAERRPRCQAGAPAAGWLLRISGGSGRSPVFTGACPAMPTCWRRASRALLQQAFPLLGLGAQKLKPGDVCVLVSRSDERLRAQLCY